MLNTENKNFLVVNAFAVRPFGGNPAGIFPHAEGLSDEEMQLIARQLNLVETVFVFRGTEPNVDRHLRYFTPLKELPIAGHPTSRHGSHWCMKAKCYPPNAQLIPRRHNPDSRI